MSELEIAGGLSAIEQLRIADLMSLAPESAASVLEIGARDGRVTSILRQRYPSIVALDLERPSFTLPDVTTVAGDVQKLEFPDAHFDLVVCTEVLEHVPGLEQAARELLRVTRSALLIGVPYRQDTRLGRTICQSCGAVNPPWGHINRFDERRLAELFPGAERAATHLVGVNPERTNRFSVWLMDIAGNPWGTYQQQEPCIRCGGRLIAPERLSLPRRAAAAAAGRLNRLQSAIWPPRAGWIHLLLRKP